MANTRLSDLPRERRLALGLFLLSILFFYLLAQAKIVTAVGGDSGYPGPSKILEKYHGSPKRSLLHSVLDPSRPEADAKNMYKWLGGSPEEKPARRASILSWVEAGFPRDGWLSVAPIFTGEETCAQCHSTKQTEGTPRARADLPFDTYEGVVAAAQPDAGMSVTELTTSSHNHMMGFAVVAILTSWIFTATRWRGPLVVLLIVGAFVGAMTDVASWWLTHYHGHPWEYLVMAGGGLFGLCVMTMVALSLDELWLGGRGGALVAKIAGPLRLGSRDPA